ncbi:MAG: tetratricopeptide repeat protein [Alphaproteobacteria bacterium]|jgi:TolA-binding protein|tara:strand:+ start:1854 stop:2783 length:930 start_codon:yes stop_codon:yes gene_type:complete
MKFLYIIILLIFHINSVQSEETNSKLSNDIDRLSNDLQDLQSFVYNNLNPNSQENEISTTEVASSDKVSDLENALKKINFRLEELEIKISDLYSLYLNQNTVTLSTIKSSDGIIIQQDSSSIISETNETKQLGQISLNDLEGENKLPVDNAEIIEIENELLDEIQDEVVQEVNPLNVEQELIAAKNFMGSLDNSRAIQSLSKIIESKSDNRNVISESYYWLGRTYFINSNFIEAIKYFGIRHRDFEDIQNFKADNYYWLAKSLVKIGDKENACLVMEDIIFSNDYSSELGIVEDSKSLQEEQSCGLIID